MGQREILSVPTGAGGKSGADAAAASDANAVLQVTLTRPPDVAAGARRPLLLINRGVASGERDVDFLDSLAKAAADAGIIAAILEPRTTRLILEDFNDFTFEDEVADLLSVIRHIEQRADVDAGRVDLLGWSLGAPATLEAAKRAASINRICLVNPAPAAFITTQLERANAAAKENGRESVPAAWIASVADSKTAGESVAAAPASLMIVHAAADRFIPPSVSLDWRMGQSPSLAAIERVLIARADHSFTNSAARQACVERIVAFFRSGAVCEVDSRDRWGSHVSALPDYAEALRAALTAVDSAVQARLQSIAIEAAAGRVLAEPIVADRDLPPFNRAMMDGYALRAADFDAGRVHGFPVVGEVPAGASADVRVPAGACVKIATGAPLPADCDTVIQHEVSDRGNPVHFTIDRIDRGNAVHPRAADAKKGDVLVASPIVLAAQHLGIAAAVGATELRVRAKPHATVLTSGDEVMPFATAAASLQPQQIRNSNSVMLCELLRRVGAEPARSHHVPDQRDATIDAVRRAVGDSDLVLTVGGVSAGERDHFPTAFDACGVKRFLIGASIQPGRPIVVGRTESGVIVIGLPGNPVSALACACLFAWPLVRAMLGLNPSLPWREVELGTAVKPNAHRRAFRPAVIRDDGKAIIPTWAGSGDLAHTAPTHGLLELPVQTEAVAAGSRLRFLPWP